MYKWRFEEMMNYKKVNLEQLQPWSQAGQRALILNSAPILNRVVSDNDFSES